MRGFVLFFVEQGQDVANSAARQVCASVGESEKAVVDAFRAEFGQTRQLIGVVSLEEIERHHALILQCASLHRVSLERSPTP